jgi:hypothetical protein
LGNFSIPYMLFYTYLHICKGILTCNPSVPTSSSPILSGWITIESNKAKPLVAPSVCKINQFAGLETSRRVPMDNNPANIRRQVPRQLGIFDRRWSVPSLCAYEEQRPPTSSANALQTNQDGADELTNTIDAHRSQPKGGRNRAAHLLAATNASQRWKAKSNRVPRHATWSTNHQFVVHLYSASGPTVCQFVGGGNQF